MMKRLAVALLLAVLAGCATPVPSPTVPKLVCGRVDPADCSAVEALVTQQVPFVARATAIVMDDVCQPGEACPIGLHVLVAILMPRDPTVSYASWPPTYFAESNSPDLPMTLVPWSSPLPALFTTLLQSAGFSG